MGEARRVAGVPYKDWSGNVSIKIAGRGEDADTYGENVLVDDYGNQNMMEIDETGTWIDVLYSDTPTNMNEDGVMFADYVKPEFTYEYANTIIGDGPTGDKTVKVVFDIVDKYFKEATIDKDDITVSMSGYDTQELQNTITKRLGIKTMTEDLVVGNVTYKANGDIYYNIGGGSQKIGERYELIISGLEKLDNEGVGDGFLYSGSLSLSIIAGIATDYSTNVNDAITITIGIDETDGDTTTTDGGVEKVVDVVDPVWETVESADLEPGEIKIRAKDKYFNSTDIDESDITVLANGVASPEIELELSDPTYLKLDAGGNYITTEDAEEADAVEYTIQLANVTVENAGHIEFTPKDENGNIIEIVGGTAQYVAENGGQVKIKVAKGTAIDDSGNVNKETTFDMGFMDDTRPEVYDIQKTQDQNAKTVTMVFNVTDRNYDPSDLVTTEEIEIWLDGKLLGDTNGNNQLDEGETCPIAKNITQSVEIKAEVDNTVKILGHQYTLVLSEMVETQAEFVATGRDFRELSGTLEIRIKNDASKDLNGNKLNPEKLKISDFVDFIKPEITYEYAESSQAVPGDINYTGKTFTMVFDIIDKYFKESTLTIDDLTILIDNDEPDWREIGETVGVTKNLTSEPLYATFNKTIDEDANNNSILDEGEDINGNGTLDHSIIVNAEYKIGERYTLVLSNLEQLEILAGKQYLDYSGVITVAIANEETNGKVTDTTGNANNAKTITSGIDIKGDVQSENDSVTVDVVDPLWEIISTSANAINQTATIKIKGTDKFYASSDLTDKIQVFEHTGSTPGTTGLSEITSTVTIIGADSPTRVDKTGTTEQIGNEYTITITGFAQDVNQIKINILEDAMLDTSGNGNKLTEIIAYNALKLTTSETEATSGFLGETSIQRQNIHKVIFVSNTDGSTGAKKVWDVSAAGDNSILAWYNETSAPYTVYIGSDSEIFANQNSSYLFSYIGSASSSTEIEAISTESLNKLNTNSVTNMSYMFNHFGSDAMTNLSLGNFETTNVTNMSNMFNSCGSTTMVTLNLGTTFDTTKVTDMSGMFQNCGATAMTTLDLSVTGVTFKTNNVENMSNMFNGQTAITTFNLGSNFNTSKVENMSGMFQNFGLRLTTLTLGDNFYTSEVIDMSNMFNGAGATAMTTLSLGANFDTTKVENMSGMFQNFGTTAMTTLDLGEKFFTTSVKDMRNMFNGCGTTAMTTLDLGPAFTKIPNKLIDGDGNETEDSAHEGFVTNCGKSGMVIKVPESIYSDMKHFKLNTDSAITIEYTRGTIQPIYKPEWIKVSSSLTIEENLEDSTMTIIIDAKVDETIYADSIKTLTYALTAGNDTSNIMKVLVDGEFAEEIKQTVSINTRSSDLVVDDITYKTNGDIYVTINSEPQLIGKQYKIVLSDFVELTRRTGKNFKEWAGNVALRFDKGSLIDSYGNKNMVEIDINPSDLTIKEPIQINDDEDLDYNVENDKMFADFVKPEFTYEFSETIIGDGNHGGTKIVKIVFDVTDKYFKETSLATDTNANLIEVKVGSDVISSGKTLTKKEIFVMNKATKAITTKATDYELQSTEQKVGERYELLIENLESSNGEGFSGYMTLTFPENIIEDKSGNKNIEKAISIGVDEPTNPEHDGEPEGETDHTTPVIVDVVNPLWVGLRDVNSIDRTNNEVNIKILGIDKYYKQNTLTTSNITVYVDLDGNGTIEEATEAVALNPTTDMRLTAIDATELATLGAKEALNGYDDVEVGYTLTLKNFGTVSGKTMIKIADGTIEDESGNKNENTEVILAGNTTWTETGDNETTPRYPAFRNDIVDFIKPVITYEYSIIEGEENPDIDYELKTVTVKFTVTDKYLLASDLINNDNTAKNISIIIAGTDRTANVETHITADNDNIADGEIVYTLTVSNIQQDPNNGFDFSGTMQLLFEADAIEDTSGNKNVGTTITLDTEIGSDVVDVVDPVIYYRSSSIDRITSDSVTLMVRADDKYISSEKLVELQDNVIVKVVKPNGYIVESTGTSATLKKPDGTVEETTVISRNITKITQQSDYITFQIVLSGFGAHEGKTSVIIPEDMILDTSNNGNETTEIEVGSETDATAFGQSIVDFTNPIWEYSVSSINRDTETDGNGNTVRKETGTVTLEVKATDIYFDDKYFNDTDYQLNLSNVKVFIDENENNQITKTFATNADDSIKKEYITETLENGDILKGVKYTIILGNFTTNEGQVKIQIPKETIKDTSTNSNIDTPINVGNPDWIENDVETDVVNPKYTGFRNNIVDFIKPIITYQYVEDANPIFTTVTGADGEEKQAIQIKFNVTDTNYLESDIELEDIQIFVDVDSNERNVTNILTKSIDDETIENGMSYTLTLSEFEQDRELTEVFKRHSGAIKLIIAKDQVADSSGNKNVETTIIVDNDDGDDITNAVIVDFVKPIIYYDSQYINWNERYAEIKIKGTDRFFDSDSVLDPEDIKLYELNTLGQYIEVTDFDGKIEILKDELEDEDGNLLGYDYTIKLNEFVEEYKMKVSIPAGYIDETDGTIVGLGDTSGNLNEATEIELTLDNKKPRWEYISKDTTLFESEGKIIFNVKGVDKFLDLDRSGLNLTSPQLKVLRDGVDITSSVGIVVTEDTVNSSSTEKSKAYNIEVTSLTEIGTYSLVFRENTLIDEFNNESAAKTITFSKSSIASNTENYIMVTYHISPDEEQTHNSFVHELMSVNVSGTNYENTTYRPSTLGELHNDGQNPLFAEPEGKSFAGWAEADEDGNPILNGTEYKKVYGLYEEISNTVEHLKAIWQNATVIYVSKDGDNSNTGTTTEDPVQDIQTANSKLSSSGTAENNIIVIMDEIIWDSATILSNNATITSLYAGIDYRLQGAELKIDSNIATNKDIIFDNIELYTDSTTTMLIANYNDITLGRRITTPSTKYTIGSVIGGNYDTESSTGNLGEHTIRVEAGKYNNIIAGSSLTSATTTSKSVLHKVVIGNMKEAAISRNDKLTITGYLAIGENELRCYPNGAQTSAAAINKEYANVTLYSGTFTGTNKGVEDTVIYLRSINGETDGQIKLEMYGGAVNGNIYGGTASTTNTTNVFNTINFYGGQVNGDVFGQGVNEIFTGSSLITLQGNIKIEGNIFGGSNVTTELAEKRIGQASSTITVNTSSATISGNIYGGSKATTTTTDFYVEGNTNITLNSGSVSNIYGGGFGSDIFGTSNITVENGTVTQNVFGGAYQGQVRMTSNITVLGGTISGNIYGGNDNTETLLANDTKAQDIKIIIGDTDETKAPTISGIIYGSGKYDKVDEVEIQLIECENVTTVYGGSNTNAETATTKIYLNGMTVNEIYGGSQSVGVVTTSNIYLEKGTVTDVYGGGYAANVAASNITVEGTSTVTTIYGGTNGSASQTGSVTTSNVTLKSATSVTNVFGGGNGTPVVTANVTLDGLIIDTIHGGSKNAGVTTKTNVKLISGTVTNVFGGGLDVGVETANVTHGEDAIVYNIYGGNNSLLGIGGNTTTTNIKIGSQDKQIEVNKVYGGNYQYGTTRYTNITIQGDTIIHEKLYGGGYKSNIGTDSTTGSTKINISGGTISGDIFGGSEQSIVYGTTNLNIGVEAARQATSDYTLKENNIIINGTIYGAGTLTSTNYSETSVQGNTNILLDNSTDSPITIGGSVIGAGKGTKYSPSGSTDTSTIHLKDFGTSANIYTLSSIERTGDLYIGNSFIELIGNRDISNKYYTINRITNALTVYDNTTLYTRKGFNMVGGFNSYVTKTGTKATAEISGTTVTTNVDNRLYTLEGINLIFAKVEVNRTNRASIPQSQWGEVNGMTFFGMYANRSGGTKYYDIYAPNYTGNAEQGFFVAGTYVEAQQEYNHTLTTDGFYTNEGDYTNPNNITITPKILKTVGEDVIDGTNYYDWLIGTETVKYHVSLIASTYSKESIAEVLLDYEYVTGTSYEISKVSTNALNPDISLINSSNIPIVSASNANNTFALTMETERTGWLETGLTNIYTADNGSFGGDTSYTSDSTTQPGKLIFRLFNSVNITEQKDLGNVNIVLRGQKPTSEDGNEAGQFIVIIAVELQSIVEERELHYVPRFTNSIDTELDYTSDSKVDLSYLLYKEDLTETVYESGDYRILSTSMKLPAGTKLTMRDCVQNQLYYYHVTDSTPYTIETTNGELRYIYRLSNFIEIGGTTSKYSDNNSAYYNSNGYILEKYDISIDFVNSGINTNTLAQETYIELRKTDGSLKYDNGNTDIKYNLYYNQSAEASVELEGVQASYTITDDITIPFTLTASMLEQGSVIDTKYDNQITGIAIKIVDTNGIVTVLPELQNFKLVNVKEGTEYYSDLTGVIRLPIMDSFATLISDYKLVFTQANVEPGKHYVEVHLYTADDGLFYGEQSETYERFEVIFVSKASGGLAGLVADSDSRIIDSQTGENLKVENNKGLDMTMSLVNATEDTNVRVELYKRNPTYTVTENADGSQVYTYTGTSYKLVDLKDYLKGDWETPEKQGLTTPTGSVQYMFYPEADVEAVAEQATVETILQFQKEIVEGIDSGEYKLVFTAYHKDKLIQTVRKTFIITQ